MKLAVQGHGIKDHSVRRRDPECAQLRKEHLHSDLSRLTLAPEGETPVHLRHVEAPFTIRPLCEAERDSDFAAAPDTLAHYGY